MPKWIYALLAIVAIGCMFAIPRLVSSDETGTCGAGCSYADCENDGWCNSERGCQCLGGVCQ